MLLVLHVKCLVVLDDALLQLVELIVQQFGLLALGVLGIRENDTSVALESSEDRQEHVGLVIHSCLQLEADLLFEAADSLVRARDLRNVEVGHDDEHEEGRYHPQDPDHRDVDPQENVRLVVLPPDFIVLVARH